MSLIVLIILALLPSFILGEERKLEEFPACVHRNDCPSSDYCAAFFCINLDTAKADSVCAEGEEEACNCLLVDGSETGATDYTKRRGVCLDKQESSCGSEEGALCDPERVCLGGICAPKVYKERLINKTKCLTHGFCQEKNLGRFCCKDFTADNEDEAKRRCCDSDLELVLPNTAVGRQKLNEALSEMEDKLEPVCRSEALKEHISSMEACQDFISTTTTTTTTTEATTSTTTSEEPTDSGSGSGSGVAELEIDFPSFYRKVTDGQAVKSLSNIRLCKTPALLLLSVVVLIFL